MVIELFAQTTGLDILSLGCMLLFLLLLKIKIFFRFSFNAPTILFILEFQRLLHESVFEYLGKLDRLVAIVSLGIHVARRVVLRIQPRTQEELRLAGH